jgi:CDP-paratose 2-epimerase
MSLRQLSAWCEARFGAHSVAADPGERPFDIPWMVMDSTLAAEQWGWQPEISLESILDEIAEHTAQHPDWLELSS